MTTRTSRKRRLTATGTMIGMALAVTAVPLSASALVTTDASAPTVAGAVTEVADDDLVAMRDEERLAGDTYSALAELTDAEIFSRIAGAEQRHQSAVERLLTARGVDVETLDHEPGEYSVDAYEELYDEFLARGEESLDSALEVGLQIEERDIADLQGMLEQDLSATERRVVEALLRGSEHHLAAFTQALDGDLPDGPLPGAGKGWGADRDGNGFGGMRGQGRQGGPGAGMGQGMGHGPGMGQGPVMGQGQGPGSGDCLQPGTES